MTNSLALDRTILSVRTLLEGSHRDLAVVKIKSAQREAEKTSTSSERIEITARVNYILRKYDINFSRIDFYC